MKTDIQSSNFVVKQPLIRFINKKVGKLIILDDHLIYSRIYLKIDKISSILNKIVEIRLHSSYGEYFAKKKCDTFEESVTLVVRALRKQMIKIKEIRTFY